MFQSVKREIVESPKLSRKMPGAYHAGHVSARYEVLYEPLWSRSEYRFNLPVTAVPATPTLSPSQHRSVFWSPIAFATQSPDAFAAAPVPWANA